MTDVGGHKNETNLQESRCSSFLFLFLNFQKTQQSLTQSCRHASSFDGSSLEAMDIDEQLRAEARGGVFQRNGNSGYGCGKVFCPIQVLNEFSIGGSSWA